MRGCWCSSGRNLKISEKCRCRSETVGRAFSFQCRSSHPSLLRAVGCRGSRSFTAFCLPPHSAGCCALPCLVPFGGVLHFFCAGGLPPRQGNTRVGCAAVQCVFGDGRASSFPSLPTPSSSFRAGECCAVVAVLYRVLSHSAGF